MTRDRLRAGPKRRRCGPIVAAGWAFALAAAAALPFTAGGPARGDGPDAPPEPKWTVADFKATIGDGPPTILERPNYLVYYTPYFTADATVHFTAPEKESYTIGFIQQVDSMDNRIDYGKAFTTWELPRAPMNDVSSRGREPWYDVTNGREHVMAGDDVTVAVAMDDDLSSSITWSEPLPPNGVLLGEKPELEHVRRDQKLTTWLVAWRDSDGKATVLKKVVWRMQVDLDVDATRPIGSRCKVNKTPAHPPVVSDGGDETIPAECLKGPTANAGQEFWWNPKPDEKGRRTRLKP